MGITLPPSAFANAYIPEGMRLHIQEVQVMYSRPAGNTWGDQFMQLGTDTPDIALSIVGSMDEQAFSKAPGFAAGLGECFLQADGFDDIRVLVKQIDMERLHYEQSIRVNIEAQLLNEARADDLRNIVSEGCRITLRSQRATLDKPKEPAQIKAGRRLDFSGE